jgi:predicted HTH transcriptional regulator
MSDLVDQVLDKLAVLLAENRWEELETDGLEIKPVPADTGSWRERHKSVNAFLNTRGGILLLGFKEEGQGPARRWVFSGYRDEVEAKLKEFHCSFTDREGTRLDLREAFPPPQIRDFMGGRVAALYVDELPADRKFVFYRGEAWKRVLTGDHRLTESEIERQQEYRDEVWHARELQPVAGATLADLDLDPLNEYIQQLNRPVKVETIKPDLEAALPFLERKGFVKDGAVTTLGILVCGRHPEDRLGFRCHVHGYVDVPQQVAQDKQDLIGNILPLMQNSLSYILRNIQIGVSLEKGGTAAPQYPEAVLRETVNNALAHRDYSINKQAIISIKPGQHVAIRNPGCFRRHLLIENPDDPIPLRRIIPEAKARNPKLADVLRVYRKWEGKGIGMATLVNLCLANQIDLPTYRIYSEEVCLFLNAGSLFGERMETYLKTFDAHIREKLGSDLNEAQKVVLSYLMKSEWANEQHHHTILLTPDNNHFEQLLSLERAGLISKHEHSTPLQPIYIADRVLMRKDYRMELEDLFGDVSGLAPLARRCLNVMWRKGQYCTERAVTARQAAFSLWYEDKGVPQSIREFEGFYRKVKTMFNKLEASHYIVRQTVRGRGFVLNSDFKSDHLL